MAKAKKESSEDPMVAQAFDASKHEHLAQMISELSPEAAAHFVAKLEAALKKRKLQITGYLLAFVVWAFGMFFALVYVGSTDGFDAWAFLLPFGAVGLILYVFGKWSEKVGNSVGDPPVTSAAPPPKSPAKKPTKQV